MLFERQRQLLTLLDALGGSVGFVDFQKLLFLYCEEPSSGRPYEFVPYKFGPFSFTSYADRRKLVERVLLEFQHRNGISFGLGRWFCRFLRRIHLGGIVSTPATGGRDDPAND